MRPSMRCDQVQEEFARESVSPALVEAVNRHVANCPACRSVQLFYSRMHASLKRTPVWDPPAGFVEGVVARAAPTLQRLPEAPRLLPRNVVQGGVLALLVMSVVICVAVLLFVQAGVPLLAAMANNALPVAWASAVLSLCISGWVTRRALRW